MPALLHSQEEERERRMDFVPEESAVNVSQIEVSACLLLVRRHSRW